MIQRAGAHAHQHLIFARLCVGNVFVGEDFRSTKFMNADGFHVDLLIWDRYHKHTSPDREFPIWNLNRIYCATTSLNRGVSE